MYKYIDEMIWRLLAAAHRMFSRYVMKNITLKDILFILFNSLKSTRRVYLIFKGYCAVVLHFISTFKGVNHEECRGLVLECLRLGSCGLEPHQRDCIVSFRKTLYRQLSNG